MTGSGPWPTGRHVLAWWRELAGLSPRRLWVAQLCGHRIEALCRIARLAPTSPLRQALLRFLDLYSPLPPTELPLAVRQLHLEAPVAVALLRGLVDEGLAATGPAGWALTAEGRRLLAGGTAGLEERRSFWFLDRTDLGLPPHLLPLVCPDAQPRAWQEAGRFDPLVLAQSVEQSSQWKQRFGFPQDIEAVLLPQTGEAVNGADWRRVVLDQPEQITALLAELPSETATDARLVAFSVRAPEWALYRGRTVLELDRDWEALLGSLVRPLPQEQWRKAWRDWCQPRGVPPGEAESCRIEIAGTLLRVHPPARLIERLRAARSDAIKQEAWLLAGTGPARALARIELIAEPMHANG